MLGGRDGISNISGAELRRRVHEIMKCRVNRDFDRMMRHFSRDVVVYYTCSKKGLFRPGVWRGREAFRENMRLTDIEYQPLDGEIRETLVDGNRVAVRWRSVWRHVGTGKQYTLEMAHFMRWENDVVVEVHEFLDRLGFYDPIVTSMMTLDQIISPPSPGLDRAEITLKLEALVNFSPSGPDLAMLRDLCSPSIVCEFVGDRARIPYSGRHIGVHSLASIIREIGVEFHQVQYETVEILVEGGRIALRRKVEWRHHGTSLTGGLELADFARVEDGKIVELIEYRDSDAVLAISGDLEPA